MSNFDTAFAEKMIRINANDWNKFDTWERDVIRDRVTGRIVKGPDGTDAALNVSFSAGQQYNKLKSAEKGSPVFTDVDYVTITVPNRPDLSIHKPVRAHDAWRFRKEYEAFKAGKNITSGIPLSNWELVTPTVLSELNSVGIYTVEQLASLPETNAASYKRFFDLHMKAQAFVNRKEGDASAKKDKQIADLTEKLNQAVSMLERLGAEKTGNKKKSATSEE